MGGTVSVESTPGAGSTFTFTLPIETAAQGDPWPRAISPRTAVVDMLGRSGDILALYLSVAGYGVVRADAPGRDLDIGPGALVFTASDADWAALPHVSIVRCAALAEATNGRVKPVSTCRSSAANCAASSLATSPAKTSLRAPRRLLPTSIAPISAICGSSWSTTAR